MGANSVDSGLWRAVACLPSRLRLAILGLVLKSRSRLRGSMAFCGNCGRAVTEGNAFCPQCGASLAAGGATSPTTPTTPLSAQPVLSTGLQENVAAMLCYLLGWLTGIVFLLVDKRPFVRFHAAQSIVVFGALSILRLALGMGVWGSRVSYGFWSLASMLVGLLTLIAWVVLMIMAYQGKRYEAPIAGPIANNIAGTTSL